MCFLTLMANLKNLTKSLINYQLIRGSLTDKCQTWNLFKLYSRVLIFTKQVVSLDNYVLKSPHTKFKGAPLIYTNTKMLTSAGADN